MTSNPSKNPPTKDEKTTRQNTVSGCLTRMLWMVWGNLLLIGSALFIMQSQDKFISVADLALAASVALLIGARYVDIKYMEGNTSDGAPASMKHFRNYVGIILMAAALIWGMAHLLAYYKVI